jgi:beta-catenin-like protein 1
MTLEKRIAKNQNMRMKFASQPEKYMESELDLHATINELFVLAASPELYHIFVHNRGMEFLLNLVTHDNTDISLAIISLLQELLDEDVIREDDHADIIIDEFLKLQGLELIIQNLSRLDETNDEDAQGVYNIMTILENLINLRPTIAIFVCLKTQILKFLLIRLKVRKFDANKLYCSEILSILLQASEENQRLICQLQGIDGIEAMLLAIAPYRKRDPASYDEQV